MKLPQLNNNNERLHIHLLGDVYSMPIYTDFSSKRELDEFVKQEYNINKNNYVYYYTKY